MDRISVILKLHESCGEDWRSGKKISKSLLRGTIMNKRLRSTVLQGFKFTQTKLMLLLSRWILSS